MDFDIKTGGRTQRVGGSKSDVIKVSSAARQMIILVIERNPRAGIAVPCFAYARLWRRPTAMMCPAPPELRELTAKLRSLPPPR